MTREQRAKRDDTDLRCSFCWKPQNSVQRLISGPSGGPRAYICDECVAVLLEQGRLRIAGDVPQLKRLVEELMAMRVRVSNEGGQQFGAWREGEHDDLALACWRAKGDEREVGEMGCGRVV